MGINSEAHAKAIRRAHLKRRKERIRRVELVSNEPLREHFLMLKKYQPFDYTSGLVAHRAGFVRTNGKPDTSYVQRLLGLRQPNRSIKKGKVYETAPMDFIQYELAVRLARAMNMDPVDAGV